MRPCPRVLRAVERLSGGYPGPVKGLGRDSTAAPAEAPGLKVEPVERSRSSRRREGAVCLPGRTGPPDRTPSRPLASMAPGLGARAQPAGTGAIHASWRPPRLTVTRPRADLLLDPGVVEDPGGGPPSERPWSLARSSVWKASILARSTVDDGAAIGGAVRCARPPLGDGTRGVCRPCARELAPDVHRASRPERLGRVVGVRHGESLSPLRDVARGRA